MNSIGVYALRPMHSMVGSVHAIQEPVQVLAVPLTIKAPANVPRKAVKEGLIVLAPLNKNVGFKLAQQ